MARNPIQTGFSRVFLIEGGANPANVPLYQGLAKIGALSWPQGDVTPIRIPSETQYNAFDTIGKIRGDEGLPSSTLMSRYTMDRSELLRIARQGCDFDLQVHMGDCKDPRDFNNGWKKILVFERAAITTYGTGDLGALQPSERALINEEVPIVGENLYEILRQTYGLQAGSQMVQEGLDVVICDSVTCAECGLPSDGCSVVFVITTSAGGSPGLAAEVVFTRDGGGTWSDTLIDTLSPTENPVAAACVGTRLVVTNATPGGLHYAPILDILVGTETWQESTAGLTIPTGGPRAIFSIGPTNTWVFGAGGYIYFYTDITGTAQVQDAGTLTTQQYNAAHGIDSQNVVAVGNSNVVVFTRNGGRSWASVTGPSVGVNLNTVWMKSPTVWLIGNASGALYYTSDSGTTWTQLSFSGSGTGSVRDLSFSTDAVGYMAHDVSSVGYILRTLDGGHSWYRAPELEMGTMPTHVRSNALAACRENANTVFATGLATGSVDGVIIKGS